MARRTRCAQLNVYCWQVPRHNSTLLAIASCHLLVLLVWQLTIFKLSCCRLSIVDETGRLQNSSMCSTI